MANILNAVRNLDLFAVPVSLTYKGRSKFSTLLGGCFSLIIILVFLVYAVWLLQDLIFNPILKSNAELIYFSNSDNTEAYNITTRNATPAVLVSGRDLESDLETNKFLRVVFLQVTPDGTVFLPAVHCTDFFADETNESNRSFFSSEFLFGQWVCPDTSQVDFLNEEYFISAEVYPCTYA